MVQRVSTVAFEGIEARAVDVQVQVAPGLPAFIIVGLPDKAVSEAKQRVRAALVASGLALPARRITINLAPADLPKEGSHYDLPIALGLMAAIGAIPHDAVSGFAVLGELGLDGSIAPVAGVLPAAIAANAHGHGLICPAACGPEAAWASPEIEIIAAQSLIQLANHFKGTQVLARPQPDDPRARRRAARSAGHQGAGERQARARNRRGRRAQPADDRAARRRQIDAGGAAALDPAAAHAGRTARRVDDRLGRRRDRGRRADQRAGRSARRTIPPACRRWSAAARAPARAKSRWRIMACCSSTSCRNSRRRCSMRCASRWRPAPSRSRARTTASPIRRASMLVGAMNPCRCGRAAEPGSFLPARPCALRGRLSGADLRPAARPHRSADRGAGGHRRRPDPAAAGGRQPRGRRPRRAGARDIQTERYAALGLPHVRSNAQARRRRAGGDRAPDAPGVALLREAADAMRLSARGYHRVLRVARTLADLDGADKSAASIWPKRCPIARSPTRCGGRRERRRIIAACRPTPCRA